MHDKHTYNLFVSVNDEIPSELVRVFGLPDELLLAEVVKMTIFRPYHNRYFSEVDGKGVDIAVDFSGDLGE